MKKIKYTYSFLLLLSTITYAQQTKVLKYKDNIIAKKFWYNNNKKLDSVKTFYKTGELNEVFFYDNNRQYHGTGYQLNRKGEKLTTWNFKHGKLIKRVNHQQVYNEKNKETRIKAYANIQKQNKFLKNKFHFGRYVSRAYSRYTLGNFVLAQRDFHYLKHQLEKLKKKKSKWDFPKKHASVYGVLGDIYSSYENEEKACYYKYLAVKTNPTEYRLIYNLGSYLVYIKSYKLGMYYLSKVLKKHPKHPFANWALGIAYTDFEEYDKALEYINTAAINQKSINKLSAGTYERDLTTLQGYLNHKLGDTEKGIQQLKKAIKIQDDNSFALRYLGEVYFDVEEYSNSCKFLNDAKKLGYEKKHDRDDLQYFIDQSCFETQSNYVSIKNSPQTYPNPVNTTTKVVNYPHQNFRFLIKNYKSNVVLEGISNGNIIDLSSLPKGLYILLLNEGVNPVSIKLIKE